MSTRVVAGSYGYPIVWEVGLHVDLTGTPTLGECALVSRTGRRVVSVTLDTATRQLSYTVGHHELDMPGPYIVTVEIKVAAGHVERVFTAFTVYPA